MSALSPLALAALERARRGAAPAPKPAQGKQLWSESEALLLTLLYPNTPMPELTARFQRHERAIYSKAAAMGLKRSAAYLASEHACRLRRGDNIGEPHRFKPGNQAWNAGLKGWKAGGRSAETRFKPGSVNGRAAQLEKPVGHERVTKDGILQRKIRADGPLHKRWKSVHEILWEEHHGPRPAGHLVVFRDGNRRNIQLDNLELITRAENCRRNTIHRYPPELRHAIRKLAKLKRTIEGKTNEEPA